MDLLTQIGILVVALAILVKSADYFIESAETIGKWFGIPSFVIGITLVALGTSLPELIASIISVYEKSSEIVLGNVIGSNIANVLLIIGCSALCTKEMTINWNIFKRDLPMFFASGLLLCFVVWPLNAKDTYVTMGESILLVVGYFIYTYFCLTDTGGKDEGKAANKTPKATSKPISGTSLPPKNSRRVPRSSATSGRQAPANSGRVKPAEEEAGMTPMVPIVFFASMFGIFVGAQYTISSVIAIAEIVKIGKEIVAISAVSIGTSLPELMVSISAVLKKKYDVAFGNVAGSNIFNIFTVVGIPGIYANISGPGVMITKTVNDFAMPYFMFTYVLFLVVMMDNKVTRMEGIALLMCYFLFVGKLFAFL